MSSPSGIRLILFVCAAARAAPDLLAADGALDPERNWHQWRGPHADGVAVHGNPPVAWSPARNVRWRTEIPGEGSSTPIVWGDRIFVLSAIATDRADASVPRPEDQPERPFGIKFPRHFHRFVVHCLDRTGGRVIWERTATEQVPHEGRHADNDYASASPTTDGEALYVSFGSRGIFCYGLDGELRWERDLGDMETRRSFGEAISPVVWGDSLVINWDHEGPSFIEVLDKRSGKTRWRRDRDEVSTWGTPLVRAVDGRAQVIVNATARARAYDLETGDELWQCGGQTVNVIPSPVANATTVFCTSGYRGQALYAIPLAARGDITGTDSVRWSFDRGTPYVPSPLLVGDDLWFTQSNQAIVTCLDARDGREILARQRIPDARNLYASPVAAAGRVYFVDRGGRTVVVDRGERDDSSELRVLATNEIGEPVDASPAIAGDELFLRGERHVFCVARTVDADGAFDDMSRRWLDGFPALSPVSATSLGDHRFDGELDDVSDASRARKVAFARRFLDELMALPRAELSRERQVDAALLEQDLRGDLFRLEELREGTWNPLVWTGLCGGAIYGLVAREFAPLERRFASVASRLEQYPRLLRQVRATLEPARVPAIHAETAIQQNRGVLSILDHRVAPRLGEVSAAVRERVEAAIVISRAAVEEHQKWLEDELLPRATADFRLGAALYDRKLAFSLQTPLARREVRERAELELSQVRDEMYDISREVYAREHPYTKFPDAPDNAYRQAIIRAALEVAYAEVPPRDRIVETAREALARITAFVREKRLVTVPDDPIEIIVMPEFQRGVSLAYCDAPGPLDVGQKTFYAVAPLPEDWNEQQVRSFLREYNLRSLHNLTIHEAVPGHFLQLAHANRHASTLRAVLASGTFIEGWAVYTEQLMATQGYYDGDPLMRLIALKWYLRGIANAIIDQAIHTEGMARDEAMRLMIEDTFQEEREAAAKWVRAQLTSTQLATYFVGYQEHRDLRREVEHAAGADFDLLRYHDTVLSFGSPPVRFVRALMLGLPITP